MRNNPSAPQNPSPQNPSGAHAPSGTHHPRPLLPHDPETLGRWRLLARLGAGGMGTVYLARSPGGRTVALKAVHPALAEEAEFRSRFRDEVRTTRAVLDGAGAADRFAAVVDADTEGPRPWLATEYLLAPTLQDAVEAYGGWPPEAVRALGAGLAEALAAVHRAQLVHRDFKPSNVLVTADGPRVIDFGIALSTGAERLTRTGYVMGSAAYMAPEQADSRASTAYSDVFALAGVIVFAATGRGPFGSGTSEELLYRVVHAQPDLTALAAVDPDGSLHRLLARCLAKDPTDRPSAAELARLLHPENVDAPPFAALLPAPLLADIAARTTLSWSAELSALGSGGPDQGPDGSADRPGAAAGGGAPSRRALLFGAAGTLALAAAAGTGAYAAGRAARPAGGAGAAFPTASASPSPAAPAGGRAKGTAPRPVWEYRGLLSTRGRPELVGDVLVASTDTAGEVTAVDTATGETRWTTRGVRGDQPVGSPDGTTVVLRALYAQEDRLAFIAADDGRTWYSDPLGVDFEHLAVSPAVAFHERTLLAVGQRPQPGGPPGSPGPSEDSLRDRYLFAYDMDRGRMLWQRAISRSLAGSTTGVVAGEKLLILESDLLRAYDVKDGAGLWQTELLPVDESENGMTRALVSAGAEGVLVAGRELMLVDPADGRAKWRVGPETVKPHKKDPPDRDKGHSVFGAPAVGGGAVYVTATGRSVLAFDLATGRRLWRWYAGEIIPQPTSPVTYADGLVFPPSPGGRTVLTALDARSGKAAWRIRESEYSSGDTFLASDGKRLYATRGRHIRALPLEG